MNSAAWKADTRNYRGLGDWKRMQAPPRSIDRDASVVRHNWHDRAG